MGFLYKAKDGLLTKRTSLPKSQRADVDDTVAAIDAFIATIKLEEPPKVIGIPLTPMLRNVLLVTLVVAVTGAVLKFTDVA